MKHLLTRVVIFLFFFLFLNGIKVHGQQPMANAGANLSSIPNYKTFTTPVKQLTDEAVNKIEGYETHSNRECCLRRLPVRIVMNLLAIEQKTQKRL